MVSYLDTQEFFAVFGMTFASFLQAQPDLAAAIETDFGIPCISDLTVRQCSVAHLEWRDVISIDNMLPNGLTFMLFTGDAFAWRCAPTSFRDI